MLQVISSINYEQDWKKKHHQNHMIINNYDQISPSEKEKKYENIYCWHFFNQAESW